jgi:hypothetical protein
VPHRSSLIGLLHRLGYKEEADAAMKELPEEVSMDELKAWGDRHGINRDQLMDRMGGNP